MVQNRDAQIRQVIDEHGRLPVTVDKLSDSSDLYLAGLTSHGSVNLMLGLEETFGVEFPQSMLQKKTFTSIASIREALEELLSSAN